jgi:hypothetical protein
VEISQFVWPDDRIAHIARHAVGVAEFEDVCFGRSLVLRGRSDGENPVYYVLGETQAGRHLSRWEGVSCHRSGPDREREAAVSPLEKAMKIPVTDSIRELAEFWDSHDLSDFKDELTEVTAPVFVRAKGGVTVPLTGEERAAIRKIAAQRRVDEAALIHEWVIERLHH